MNPKKWFLLFSLEGSLLFSFSLGIVYSLLFSDSLIRCLLSALLELELTLGRSVSRVEILELSFSFRASINCLSLSDLGLSSRKISTGRWIWKPARYNKIFTYLIFPSLSDSYRFSFRLGLRSLSRLCDLCPLWLSDNIGSVSDRANPAVNSATFLSLLLRRRSSFSSSVSTLFVLSEDDADTDAFSLAFPRSDELRSMRALVVLSFSPPRILALILSFSNSPSLLCPFRWCRRWCRCLLAESSSSALVLCFLYEAIISIVFVLFLTLNSDWEFVKLPRKGANLANNKFRAIYSNNASLEVEL